MDEGGVAKVVQAIIGEDLCAGLEPDGLLELHAGVLLQQLGCEDAQGAEECPAGVDDLNLTVPAWVLLGNVRLLHAAARHGCAAWL